MNKFNTVDKTRVRLLKQIQQCEFTLHDLHLYLDTHPKCKKALHSYIKHQDMLMRYKEEYEKMYGTLNAGVVEGQEDWIWINGPWPWDRSINESGEY